jgi:DNA replication protein DnaC
MYKTCPACQQEEQWTIRRKESELLLPGVSGNVKDSWMDESGLPDLFRDKNFKDFDQKLQPAAYKTVSEFRGESIVLSSPDLYGVGKTHLVAALVNKLIAMVEAARVEKDGTITKFHCPVFFITEPALLFRIRNTYNRNSQSETYQESEDDLYRKLLKYELLIIDDVGKVRPKDYNFLQGVYFRIIDECYTRQKPVILTTNLDFEHLEDHIGGACADRLREMAPRENFIRMSGKSYRHRLNKEVKAK